MKLKTQLPLYYRLHNTNLTNNSNKIQFIKRRIKRDFIKDMTIYQSLQSYL